MKLYIDVRGQDVTTLYEDWDWLVRPGELSQPILLTNFGDIFYQKQDGSVWFLDTITAKTAEFAESLPDLQGKLNQPEVQRSVLLIGLVDQMAADGKMLSDSQIFSFKVPPHLGGALQADNLEISDLEVAISLAGQIQAQTHHLSPGTEIEGIGTTQTIPDRF